MSEDRFLPGAHWESRGGYHRHVVVDSVLSANHVVVRNTATGRSWSISHDVLQARYVALYREEPATVELLRDYVVGQLKVLAGDCGERACGKEDAFHEVLSYLDRIIGSS